MKNTLLFLILNFLVSLFFINTLQAQDIQKEVNFSEHKVLPGYGFKKKAHPEIFQGNKKKRNYFEGWYFKMVSEDGSSILSVIPGISISKDGIEQHAFIQIIDGKTATTNYYTFPIEEFTFSRKEFAVRIGKNYFSKDRIILDILTDSSNISGVIQMTNHVELPSKKILNSGIMGWYRFVPFMQCYHGVVSLNHTLQGKIEKDGEDYNFINGTGYIEKDWGNSMPSAWIWMQSNNFSKKNTSFMLSVANIPWLGKSFTGFLGFFLHDNKIYRFATYTKAKLSLEEAGNDTIKIRIQDKKNTFLVEAYHANSGLLKAPVKGSMDRRIAESIDAKLHLTVLDKNGIVIFSDSTSISGLEMVGDQKILMNRKKK